MKATITIPWSHPPGKTVEVEATILGPIAVHRREWLEDGQWALSHAATGYSFGIDAFPSEAEALEAAELVLADRNMTHVLEAETSDEAGTRQSQLGAVEWRLSVGVVNNTMAERRVERLKASGELLGPAGLVDLIELDLGAVEDIDHLDEVIEGIEAASPKEKSGILQALMEQDGGKNIMEWAEGYAEPGYSSAEAGVLLGDWWHRADGGKLTESNIVAIAQACGAEIEWHDEWTTCADCSKAVRTSPDSYCWTRSYVVFHDCEITCHECMEDDDHKKEFIEQELEGDPDRADTLDWDLEGLGYVRMDADFQSGLYGGQSASPHKIASALRERGIERFVFQIDDVGQFDARFSCWLHEDEEMPFLAETETDGSDPAVAMKAALQDASAKMSTLSGDGVKVATCNPDGTATVRMVSNEDFIAGKALGGE